MNVLNLINIQISTPLTKHMSGFLGESESQVAKALTGIFPQLMLSMINQTEKLDGPQKLFDLANNMDESILADIEELFAGGAKNIAQLMNSGSGVLNIILGDNTGNLIENIAEFSNLKRSMSSSLVKISAAFLMDMVRKQNKANEPDLTGFTKLITSQKDFAYGNMPSALRSKLDSHPIEKVNLTDSVNFPAVNLLKWLAFSILFLTILSYILNKT